ncbi:DUF362 domain-containing protein [Candidatus Thorarchaeota archaeon]|nr:MAG: DUF362 domain-containing protein [Candidatus Thorarchaeota archaeon]
MTDGKPTVYFGSIQHGNRARFASFAAKVDKVVEKLDFSTIEKKEKVAIKMHLGFRDGYQTLPSFFVRRIAEAVKREGGFPFVTDNPTSVYNAAHRGYTQETCGCPIIPVAGVKDQYTYRQDVDYRDVETMDLAGVLHDADVLIDLTHLKGHNSCGFGGAIKNIALGGYAGPTRWRKYHSVHQSIPYWDAEKCTPEHAKKLVKSCPDECISYDEDEHKLKLSFDTCNQCGECLEVDKDVGCLELKQEHFSAFQELMAIGAQQILDTFEEDKVFFLNFLIDITAYCDCWGIGQPHVVNDIGVVGSRDIVAAEAASLDLVAKEGLIESMIPPFMRPNLDPDIDLHPFARLHGPMKDPYIVVDYAEDLGLGSKKYELIEVLSPEETMKMEAPKGVSETEPTFY